MSALRRFGLPALGLLVVLAAWWHWSGRDATQPPAIPGESSGPDRPAEPAPGLPSPRAESGAERPDAGPVPDNSSLVHYLEMSRYPASTRRLTADSHDLLNPGARHETRQKLPGDASNPDLEWDLLYTADRYFVRGDEPVTVSLSLWRDGEAVPARGVRMVAEAVGRADGRKTVALNVAGRDATKYAQFRPNDYWPEYAGQVRVTTDFSAQGLAPQSGTLDFQFTGEGRIPARFTGEISDFLLDGDLVFEVGIEVEVAGTYRIEGNLYDARGRPFGWARFENALAPGRSSAALRYYGLLFHDAEAAGPFMLTGVRGHRMRPGELPHREDMPPLAGRYVTADTYAAGDFRSDIDASPKRRRMIEMYEDAVARGVRLTVPEYTGEGETPDGD